MMKNARWALVLLLSAGLSGASAEGRLPLTQAVTAGDTQGVRTLLAKPGTDVNATEADGSTALHYAANRGDAGVVTALLAAGADVKVANRYGVTPISLACANGSVAVVASLLKAGADVNTVTVGGQTLLMTAARSGTPELIRLLLIQGAKVNAQETTRGQSEIGRASCRERV